MCTGTPVQCGALQYVERIAQAQSPQCMDAKALYYGAQVLDGAHDSRVARLYRAWDLGREQEVRYFSNTSVTTLHFDMDGIKGRQMQG